MAGENQPWRRDIVDQRNQIIDDKVFIKDVFSRWGALILSAKIISKRAEPLGSKRRADFRLPGGGGAGEGIYKDKADAPLLGGSYSK
jgi:hypothetical protein